MTETAKQLAAVIELAHREGREVKWTVHTTGTAVFSRALDLLKQKGVSGLKAQSVFFSNPTVNVAWADALRRTVNMQAAPKPFNYNEYSLRQNPMALNFLGVPRVSLSRFNRGEIGFVAMVGEAWRPIKPAFSVLGNPVKAAMMIAGNLLPQRFDRYYYQELNDALDKTYPVKRRVGP